MKTYVIGDVAGRFDELMSLIAQFEPGSQIIQLGDMIDRGPKSKEVIEYFMAHPEHICLKGNHEDLMLNHEEIWLWNGGQQTLKSFSVDKAADIPANIRAWVEALPINHIVEIDGHKYYISHAPTPDPKRPWREEPQVLWNRYSPKRDPGYALQIFGHNALMEWFADQHGKYAVCIDDCHNSMLTALELPTLRVIQQPYLPQEKGFSGRSD